MIQFFFILYYFILSTTYSISKICFVVFLLKAANFKLPPCVMNLVLHFYLLIFQTLKSFANCFVSPSLSLVNTPVWLFVSWSSEDWPLEHFCIHWLWIAKWRPCDVLLQLSLPRPYRVHWFRISSQSPGWGGRVSWLTQIQLLPLLNVCSHCQSFTRTLSICRTECICHWLFITIRILVFNSSLF